MPYQPPPSFGFVNAERLLGLNADSGARMGEAVAGNVGAAAQGALTGLNAYSDAFTRAGGGTDFTRGAGYAGMANALDVAGNRVRALGTDAGVGQELRNAYGNTTAGGNRFDTFLTRQGGGAAPLGQAQQAYSGISNALGLAAHTAQQGGPTSGIVRVDQPSTLPREAPPSTQQASLDRRRERVNRRSNQGGY